MTVYAIFDAAGLPVAFYDAALFGDRNSPDTKVPTDAVEISGGQWQEFLDFQGLRRWENGHVVPYEHPPGEELPKTKLYKSTFIRRMTTAEATAMEQVLQAEEPWLRMLYHSVEYFMMDDALTMYLHMTLEGAFGETRADELMEPEL